MRTDKQNETAKTNGAKSKGPVTPEGKAKSSRNGMRHNLSSGHIVLLSNEDPKEFIAHSFGFLDRFAPADYVERDLVNQMIAASWRLARISAIECSLIEFAMDDLREKHDREFSFLDAHARQTLSMFGNVDKETVIRMLQRYQATASRAYSRAFRMLKELQGDRFNRQPQAPPASPEQNRDCQGAEAQPEQNRDRQAAEAAETPQPASPTETSYAPKVIVIRRNNPENRKLQSEPEAALHSSTSWLEKAMCA